MSHNGCRRVVMAMHAPAQAEALAFIATNILGASCVVHCVQSIDANMILSFRQLELLLTPSPPIFRDPNS